MHRLWGGTKVTMPVESRVVEVGDNYALVHVFIGNMGHTIRAMKPGPIPTEYWREKVLVEEQSNYDRFVQLKAEVSDCLPGQAQLCITRITLTPSLDVTVETIRARDTHPLTRFID